jgi:MFS family permease
MLLFSSCQAYFSGAGLNLHLFPYLTDAGLTIHETVLATSLFFTVSAFGSILWGFILERFPMRLCLAVALLVSAGGILLLLFTSGLTLALLFAVVYGLSFGGNHIVLSAIWPAYYGRANVGAIMGAAMPVQMLANAFGPFFGGWIYDRNGSYGVAFGVYAGVLCVGAALAVFARRPRLREAS